MCNFNIEEWMANISISQILHFFNVKGLSLTGASLYLIIDCIPESTPNVETVLVYQVHQRHRL